MFKTMRRQQPDSLRCLKPRIRRETWVFVALTVLTFSLFSAAEAFVTYSTSKSPPPSLSSTVPGKVSINKRKSTQLNSLPPQNRRNYQNRRRPNPSSFRRDRQQRQQQHHHHQDRSLWLQQATQRLLASPPGSLSKGKWHELTSIYHGWAALAKHDKDAPLRMETLLKRLLEEVQEEQQQESRSSAIQVVDIGIYNAYVYRKVESLCNSWRPGTKLMDILRILLFVFTLAGY